MNATQITNTTLNIEPTTSCPGCSGAGVPMDSYNGAVSDFIWRCLGCGGAFTHLPVTVEQALPVVALDQAMLANAGAEGQFYFDLVILTSWKGQQILKRIHGWADRQSKRVVQFG